MNPEYFPYFIGAGATIIGIFVSYFLGKRSALKIHERQRRHAACDKFRAAIAQEISLWHSCGKMQATNPALFALRDSSITAPVLEFRPFIKGDHTHYDQTHKAYEHHKEQNLSISGQGSAKAIKLLEELMKFTEH